jgi:hypothetical protein
MEAPATDKMIEGYFLSTTKAFGMLYRGGLFGQVLIQIYAAIDTCGLLDAPPTETKATGATFQAWVKKYVLPFPGTEFNEVDLWGARCAVLHTFTSESDLSRAGRARQLHYYTGDKSQPHIQHLISFTKSLDGGGHLPVHYSDLCEAFFQGLKVFASDLLAKCSPGSAEEQRLRNILQIHPLGEVHGA